MSHEYAEEISYTSSDDGFLLEGAFMRPAIDAAQPIGVIWVHGNAARFYDYPYITIGRALAMVGYPCLSVNTRGHDISAFMWRANGGKPAAWDSPTSMPVGMGSGWERLDETPRDLAAWVSFAAAQGITRVVLVGHSSGAQRVALYEAERQDARVAGIALASPDLRGFQPLGELETAQQMVADGQGLEVVPAHRFAPWYRQSAQTVANKAAILAKMLTAPEGEPTIAALCKPILAFFGSREPGGEATLATIREAARNAVVTTQIVAGADHIYTDHETEVAALLAQWIGGLG